MANGGHPKSDEKQGQKPAEQPATEQNKSSKK